MAEKPISARWLELAEEARSIADELGDTVLGRVAMDMATLYAEIGARCELAEAWDSCDWHMWRVTPYGIW